ncbi:MAG: hypothetical protein V9E81_03780 [Marmoricola sp.]
MILSNGISAGPQLSRAVLVVVGLVSAAAASWFWFRHDLVISSPLDLATAIQTAAAWSVCVLSTWLTVLAVLTVMDLHNVAATLGCPPWWRQAVLVSCGLVSVIGMAVLTRQPISSTPLVGCRCPIARSPARPVPNRMPSSLSPTHDTTSSARPSETLWRIAEEALPADAPMGKVAASTQAIYQLNRQLIGTDPDVIHPGLRLRLPTTLEP